MDRMCRMRVRSAGFRRKKMGIKSGLIMRLGRIVLLMGCLGMLALFLQANCEELAFELGASALCNSDDGYDY